MIATALPDRLDVDDLTFTVEHRPRRSTIEITVERDASLTVKTPNGASVDDLHAFIVDKKDWIYRKLAEKDALLAPPVRKQFVNGEGFAYLGRNYRLLLVDDQKVEVKLERGRFKMRKDRAAAGPAVMLDWYTAIGQTWLRGRVQPWARRLEVGDPQLRVLDLGYRWGSAGSDRINVHWATLQLRPTLIDYVLVHELTHLHEPAHTARFWRLVERAMPDYESRKDRLAAEGSHLWIGPSP